MAPAQAPFRVIIVGGGLVGVTMAHILSKTDIDYVILEKGGKVSTTIGSVISLWPPSIRILGQLGLMDTMKPLTNVKRNIIISADDGTPITSWDSGSLCEKKQVRLPYSNLGMLLTATGTSHGHGVNVISRPSFIEVLYESLPDSAKARIRANKHVLKVNIADDGVTVECSDGTVERGSIVVGADGVRSRVRECMQAMEEGALAPGVSRPNDPYLTTYRALFWTSTNTEGLQPNIYYQSASERATVQTITDGTHSWFHLYEALGKPTSERIRYTDKDKEDMVRGNSHLYTAPGLKVSDRFRELVGEPLFINLEEGRVNKWYWNRVVLLGDAVRKLQPYAGLGYNAGLGDAVTLVNQLRRLLQNSPLPSSETLEAMFAAYQKERQRDESTIHSISERGVRLTGWITPMDKIIAKYIIPYTNLLSYYANHVYGPVVARAPVLEWLEEKDLPEKLGIPYVHYPVVARPSEQLISQDRSVHGWPIRTGAIVMLALAAAGVRDYWGRWWAAPGTRRESK